MCRREGINLTSFNSAVQEYVLIYIEYVFLYSRASQGSGPLRTTYDDGERKDGKDCKCSTRYCGRCRHVSCPDRLVGNHGVRSFLGKATLVGEWIVLHRSGGMCRVFRHPNRLGIQKRREITLPEAQVGYIN